MVRNDNNFASLRDTAIELLEASGEDPGREGLIDTPLRFAKAWQFWTSGYNEDVDTIVKKFTDGSERYDGIVFQGRIPFYSLCEHHMAPFFGVAHVGYIPNETIIGLSKLARVVDVFARRLQVQERLTRQVAETLHSALDPKAVGVVLRCRHLCMESRGIQKPGMTTHTSSMLGDFRFEADARAEFLQLVSSAESGLSI